MATGSILKPAKTLRGWVETNGLPLTFVNDDPAPLTYGLAVYISGNNSVRKQTTGVQLPIGWVKVAAAIGEDVTIETIFNSDLKALVKTATINAGDLVRLDGTVGADGQPNVVAAAAGNYAVGVALTGGVVAAEIRVGWFRVPMRLPA